MSMHRLTACALLTVLGAACAYGQTTEDHEDTRVEYEGDRPTSAPVISRGQAAQPEAVRDHSPDAVARFEAARERIREGFSASVKSYIGDNSNPLLAQLMQSEGIWLQHTPGPDEWAARYSGNGTVMGEAEPVGFDILWAPDRVTWIDHGEQTLRAEPLNRPIRAGGLAYQVASAPWTQAKGIVQGFAPEFEAERLAFEGSGEVNGVRCDVVSVTAKEGAEPVYWYFGLEDGLPRRVEIRLPEGSGGGGMRVDFSDVLAGPDTVRPSDWEVEAPSGYKVTISRALQGRPTPAVTSSAPRAQMMPTWEVMDSEGSSVSPGSLRDKVSVLYFWGTWSPLCRKATPELVKLAEDYKDKPVEIVSMAFREGSPEGVVAAARDQGQTWRQVPAADDVVEMLKIRVAPSFVVMGPGGEILLQSGRPAGDDYGKFFGEVRTLIDKALAGEIGAPAGDDGSRGPGTGGAGDKVSPGTTTRAAPGGLPTRRAGEGPDQRKRDGGG